MQTKIINRLTVQDILNMDFGTDNRLIENLIKTGTITVISGQPASFKTWVCLHLALVVSGGRTFLKEFRVLSRCKVLILDKESYPKHVQTRLKTLNAIGSADIFFSFDEDLRIDDEEYVASLIKQIKEDEIGLVILDSLIRFHRGDENDSRQMSAVLSNLKKIINETGVNIIFVHHHRKESNFGASSSNSLRGSSDIFALVDCHISLSYQKKDNIIVFSHMKSRQSRELEPFSVKVIVDEDSKTMDLEYVGEYDRQQVKREEAKEAIKAVLKEKTNEALSLKAIMELLEDAYSKNIISSALDELKGNGVEITIRAHNTKFFTWVGQSAELASGVDNSVEF